LSWAGSAFTTTLKGAMAGLGSSWNRPASRAHAWPLGLRCRCWLRRDKDGDLDLADHFADLDDLGCAGDGIGFDLAPRSPLVSRIVMGNVAEHHAALHPVDEQPNASAGTGRSEVRVFDVVETMTLQA
jgi:hypothetical protein